MTNGGEIIWVFWLSFGGLARRDDVDLPIGGTRRTDSRDATREHDACKIVTGRFGRGHKRRDSVRRIGWFAGCKFIFCHQREWKSVVRISGQSARSR